MQYIKLRIGQSEYTVKAKKLPAIIAVYDQIRAFDWGYEYSDDHNVFKRASARKVEIRNAIGALQEADDKSAFKAGDMLILYAGRHWLDGLPKFEEFIA